MVSSWWLSPARLMDVAVHGTVTRVCALLSFRYTKQKNGASEATVVPTSALPAAVATVDEGIIVFEGELVPMAQPPPAVLMMDGPPMVGASPLPTNPSRSVSYNVSPLAPSTHRLACCMLRCIWCHGDLPRIFATCQTTWCNQGIQVGSVPPQEAAVTKL